MPVQRFPRYELLLRDLQRATPAGHADEEFIKQALIRVGSVNQGINETMRQVANRQKLLAITSQFVADPDLVRQGRVCLMEGVMGKISGGKREVKRKYWLFSDLFCYAKIVPGTGLISSERYLMSVKLRLTGVHIQDLSDEPNLEVPIIDAFEVTSHQQSFIVCAPSQDDKNEWMLAISNATAQEMTREGAADLSRSSMAVSQKMDALPGDVAAPKWEADGARDACPVCETRFSVLVRKQHCRLCGTLACASCTTDRVSVRGWGDDAQRVCRLCFETKAPNHPGITKLQPQTSRGLKGSLQGSMIRINSAISLSRASGARDK